MKAPRPMRAPATTTPPAAITAPSPTSSAGAGPRGAADIGPRATGLPSTALSWMRAPAPTSVPAWITTLPPSSTSSGSSTSSPTSRPGARSDGRSTRALLERALERFEHAHDPQPALGSGARLFPRAHALEEVEAFEPQWLVVRDARAPDVARARDVLPVRGEVLVEPLVVDRHLALQLHVVEGRHPARADDREAPLLVRVEPGEMQVRGEPRREAQVAE